MPLLLREELRLTDGMMLVGQILEQRIIAESVLFVASHISFHPTLNCNPHKVIRIRVEEVETVRVGRTSRGMVSM